MQDGIEAVIFSITSTIMSGDAFSLDVPSRNSANQMYIPELDRIVLKDKVCTRKVSGPPLCTKECIMLLRCSLLPVPSQASRRYGRQPS
jgi:meiotic recombination protein SPO11